MKIAKKVERFYASALAIYTDSVSPSSVDHRCAVGKFTPRRSVGGDCPNGNPSLRIFRMINALSRQVIFLGDFNSKHKQFGCVKPNKSGRMLVNIAKDLKPSYANQLIGPNRHTRGVR